MPLHIGPGHTPPIYHPDTAERLFAVWQEMAAAQHYPQGPDHHTGDEAYNACTKYLYKPSRVLLLGCGDGTEVARVKSLGHDAWGVTLNPNNAVYAKDTLKLQHIYMHDAHFNPVEWEETFDAVMGFQFLEHSPAPLILLLEVERILRQGGICYFETPGPEGWTMDRNPHHFQCPTKPQALGWLLKAGFIDVEVEELGSSDAARHLGIFGVKA